MRVELELDPDVDDEAPDGPDITVYDEAHFVTYLRLLDARDVHHDAVLLHVRKSAL